jgi:hypothetical protein
MQKQDCVALIKQKLWLNCHVIKRMLLGYRRPRLMYLWLSLISPREDIVTHNMPLSSVFKFSSIEDIFLYSRPIRNYITYAGTEELFNNVLRQRLGYEPYGPGLHSQQ